MRVWLPVFRLLVAQLGVSSLLTYPVPGNTLEQIGAKLSHYSLYALLIGQL